MGWDGRMGNGGRGFGSGWVERWDGIVWEDGGIDSMFKQHTQDPLVAEAQIGRSYISSAKVGSLGGGDSILVRFVLLVFHFVSIAFNVDVCCRFDVVGTLKNIAQVTARSRASTDLSGT
jgi:hypothetical protein